MQADTVSKTSQKITSFFKKRVPVLGRETGLDGTAIDLLELLRTMPGKYYDEDILLGKSQRMPVRLVAERLDETQKEKRLKNIHKTYRNKQPSQLVLELAGWSIYITNIPQEMLPKDSIHNVYTHST